MIVITFDRWSSCHLSIARYTGGVIINGIEYRILPPENDLVRKDWIPIYKSMGREWTINLLHTCYDPKKAKRIAMQEMKIKKNGV